MMKSVMLMLILMVMVMVIYLLPKYICKGASNHKYNKEKEHQHVVPETFDIVIQIIIHNMAFLGNELVGMVMIYVSRKHLISFMAAKHPKQERKIMAVEEMRMM